jgi:hypothetical protein
MIETVQERQRMDARVTGTPCVVQYLYVHSPEEDVSYPSSRSSGNAGRLAERYLECALVQAASLRWKAPGSELLLVSNLEGGSSLTRRGQALLERILSLGVEMVPAEYRHAPPPEVSFFRASRYVFDAIQAAAAGRDPEQRLWMVDVDCVWMDPQAAVEALAPRRGISALQIDYPPDMTSAGWSREDIGQLAARMGASERLPDWIGAEVLAGSAAELLNLVTVCEQLDDELAGIGEYLPVEEHLLTLAGTLGRIVFADLASTVGRIWTGRRHNAANPLDPHALAIWHLPSQKGLGFRRAANALLRGPAKRLSQDLSRPASAAARFNLAGTSLAHVLRDDSWIAATHLRDALLHGGSSAGPRERLQRLLRVATRR